ncbi:hypothetical protein Tco_0097478 [Tanacetum coccineum]
MLHASGSGDGVGSQPKVLDESEDKTTGTDEGTGTKPGVPDVPKYLSESENESWGDSGDDESNDDDSDEVTKDDDEDDVESDANEDKENDDEEEEHKEEYVRTSDSFEFNNDDEEYDELYKDVNVRSKVTEHQEVGKGDTKMTDTTHESASQEKSYDKFLNLDNVPPVINEVASKMDVKTPHEESSTQAPPNLSVPMMAISETSSVHVTTVTPIIQPFFSISQTTTPTPVPTIEPTTSSIPALLDFASLFGFNQRVSALEQELSQVKQVDHSVQILAQFPILPKEISDFATPVIQRTINESLKNAVLDKSSSQPQSTYEAATSLTELELKKILLDKLEKSKSYRATEQHRDLYDTLVKSYQLDKDLFDSYGKVYSLKRGHEDKDKDEDPPAGSGQGLKKRKMSKDAKPPKGSKSKESKSSSSKGSKSQSKSFGKFAQAEEPVFEAANTEMPQDQGDDLGNTEDQPNVEEASKPDWFKKPERPPTPDRDWNSGKQIDFRHPQTWISKMAKARKPPTTFDELMSTSIDFSAYGPKRHSFYGYASNRKSKHNAFSTKRIITVTNVKVLKKYDYGYLDEIIVRREDQSLHKFVEGDFPRLNMRDIEDMLLLLVQKKLSNLERDDIFDLNVALWMFTRRVVILKLVEDLQLGVESYQKKLNITRPETFRPDFTKMTTYTAYNKPQGIIYQDKFQRNSFEMDYLPKRRWSKLDRKRCRIMIKEVDQQLFERRLMRNLEKFVGGREYGNDFRLIERTI